MEAFVKSFLLAADADGNSLVTLEPRHAKNGTQIWNIKGAKTVDYGQLDSAVRNRFGARFVMKNDTFQIRLAKNAMQWKIVELAFWIVICLLGLLVCLTSTDLRAFAYPVVTGAALKLAWPFARRVLDKGGV